MSQDEQLCKILAEPEGNEPADHLETMIGLSGRMILGKYVFPAPAIAHFAILHQRNSPFLSGRKVRMTDLFETLYLLEYPEEALRHYQQETQLRLFLLESTGPEQKRKLSEELLLEKKSFRKRLLRFRKERKELPAALAVSVLRSHLGRAAGFRMLQRFPRKKRSILNLETLTGLHALCCRVVPELDQRTFLWILPLQSMAFLLVHALRAKGVRGICRDEKSRKLWEYFRNENTQGKNNHDDIPERSVTV